MNCVSITQKTNKHVVLQSVTSPNLPFSSDILQTRAGATTYSIPPLLAPVRTPSPIAQRLERHNQIRGIVVADDSSILSRGIPADVVHSSLSDMGAGQYFSNTIELPDPAPTIIMGGKI